jgi:hypothetical protein
MLRDWEQGPTEPDQPARAYLTVIARDPEGVLRALQGAPIPQGEERNRADTKRRVQTALLTWTACNADLAGGHHDNAATGEYPFSVPDTESVTSPALSLSLTAPVRKSTIVGVHT